MKHPIRQQLYAGAVGCCAIVWSLTTVAADTETTTVYRSVGANGVVSFSDAPGPAAVPVELTPPPKPLAADVERANDNYERQLELLAILETQRKARVAEEQEQQRLELDYVRTEAALDRARDLQSDYDDDDDDDYYPVWWGAPYRPNYPNRPNFPHRPPMERPNPPAVQPPQHIQFPRR